MKSFSISTLSILTAFSLFSCGGGDSTPPPPEIPPGSITGFGVDGPISGARVCAYEIDSDLDSRSDPIELCTETDEKGEYVLDNILRTDTTFLLVLTGGHYQDEYSGARVDLSNQHELHSIVEFKSGEPHTANITSLTHIASCLTDYRVEHQLDASFKASVDTSFQSVSQLFGIENILTSDIRERGLDVPDDAPDFNVTEEFKYGYVLAGVSSLVGKLSQSQGIAAGEDQTYSSINFIQAACDDIRANGVLDGKGETESDLIRLGDITLTEDMYRSGWADGILDIANLDIYNVQHTPQDLESLAAGVAQSSSDQLGGDPITDYQLTRVEQVFIPNEAFEQCVKSTELTYAYQVTAISCPLLEINDATGLEAFHNLEILDLSKNNITEIDISEHYKLVDVDLSENSLSNIVIPNTKTLLSLTLGYNQLEDLQLPEGLDNLVTLNVEDGGAPEEPITQIDLSMLPNLKIFHASSNKLSSPNFENNTKLEEIHLYSSGVESIDLRGLNELQHLNLTGNNDLRDIAFDETTKITYLGVGGCNISEHMAQGRFSFSQFPLLEDIDLTLNNLQEQDIDFSTNPLLHRATLIANQLSTIDFEHDNLRVLIAHNNPLESVQFEGLPQLIELYIEETNLQEIDISSAENLHSLNISKNPQLNSFIYNETNTEFGYVDFSNTQISNFNPESFPGLYSLHVGNSNLAGTLDVSGMERLGSMTAIYPDDVEPPLDEIIVSPDHDTKGEDWDIDDRIEVNLPDIMTP